MNLFSLNDQVILVTGSSRGLGWEMAKAMAEAGDRRKSSSAHLLILMKENGWDNETSYRSVSMKASGLRVVVLWAGVRY